MGGSARSASRMNAADDYSVSRSAGRPPDRAPLRHIKRPTKPSRAAVPRTSASAVGVPIHPQSDGHLKWPGWDENQAGQGCMEARNIL